MADWSLLPRDLLERIVDRFETSYQIVHFRSVCSSWRSIAPPLGNSRCLGIKTCIPLFAGEVKGLPKFEGGEYCTLRKIPIFLLRFQTPFGSDYLLAEMHERKSGKPMLMSSPLSGYRIVHRTLLANTAPSDGTGQTLLNTLTSQIIPLGHYYKIKYYEMTSFSLRVGVEIEWGKSSRRVQFIELDSEDCRDFVVLARIESILMMFRSRTMSWTQNIGHPKSYGSYQDMVAFKGKFYVVDSSGCGQVFVIEPSLEVSEITSLSAPYESSKESLVQSGEDLLLVQRFTPGKCHDEHMYTWFRVFRLDGEGRRRKWVRVYDLKDRVIFLGSRWNLCLSVQNLPGAKENCIVFIKSVKGMFEGHISGHDSLLVFDLRTRRTSTAFTECRGYMGAFGKNLETLVSCGLVTMPNPRTSIY